MAISPDKLARDAVRVVDRVERETLRRIYGFLDLIERDQRDLIASIDLRPSTTTSRVVRELRARQAVEQSRAARALLDLGTMQGPLVEDMRAGIRASMADGVEQARRAAVASGTITAAEAAAIAAMGSRIDLDFLDALTRATITTLRKVSEDGVRRLTEAIARGAVRGDGPRATARRARDGLDLTRYEGERIVRTVFMRANNEAREESFRSMGVAYLQWNATNDARICAYCGSRHGMVYKISEAPKPPIHPHCRCVLLPWSEKTAAADRGDAYYTRTRREIGARLAQDGRKQTNATAAAPFEKSDGTPPPRPVWSPGGGWR